MRRRSYAGALMLTSALLSLTTLIGCGDQNPLTEAGGDPTDAARGGWRYTVSAVSVTPTSFSVAVGATSQLKAAATNKNGDPVTATFTWRSADTTIAQVDAKGVVTGRKAGSTKITAASGGKTATAAATVTASGTGDTTSTPAPAATVASVALTPATASIATGATVQLQAAAKDSAGKTLTGKTFSWTTSNGAIAGVSSTGLVTGVAAGTATITATVDGKSGKATVTVTTSSDGTTPTTRVGRYVSPSGSSSGDGTASRPWDLASVLGGGKSVAPGDTVWVRGGTYRGQFVNYLNGTSSSPIVVRQYPGERATIDGNLVVYGSNTVFWGLEVMSSNPVSTSSMGINSRSPGSRFINMVVHDNGMSGFGVWSEAPNAEVYGSIIYNNGTHNNLDHGIYAQNNTGSKRIADNIVFNQMAYGIHVYTGTGGYIRNFMIEGNVSFNNGTINGTQAPDVFVGGDVAASGITVRENYTYRNDGAMTGRFGYTWGPTNGDLKLTNNYFVGLVDFTPWSSLVASGNTFYSRGSLITMKSASGASWSSNTWYRDASASAWGYNGGSYTWAGWRSASGLGGSDAVAGTQPSGVKVVVRPNQYERGRANVIVYNWSQQGSVSADLSNVLRVGDRYTVRNVQDFYGTPVLTGTYGGGSISIPTSAVAAPRPIGRSTTTAPTTGPTFNVFVVTAG
ncbi:MAG TPA: Ig-like domain-containing protein [Longimicrobiales bacterium]|nr:Ig-like domain-containing protein [Longimicrobiales bacterium]